LPSPAAPKLSAGSVHDLPDALAGSRFGNIEKITISKTRREAGRGGERDWGRCGLLEFPVGNPGAPQRFLRSREGSDQPAAIGAGCQRRIAVNPGVYPVRNAAPHIEAVEPGPGTINIAGEIHQSVAVEEDRIAHLPVMECNALRSPALCGHTPDVKLVRRGALHKIDELRIRRPYGEMRVETFRRLKDRSRVCRGRTIGNK